MIEPLKKGNKWKRMKVIFIIMSFLRVNSSRKLLPHKKMKKMKIKKKLFPPKCRIKDSHGETKKKMKIKPIKDQKPKKKEILTMKMMASCPKIIILQYKEDKIVMRKKKVKKSNNKNNLLMVMMRIISPNKRMKKI